MSHDDIGAPILMGTVLDGEVVLQNDLFFDKDTLREGKAGEPSMCVRHAKSVDNGASDSRVAAIQDLGTASENSADNSADILRMELLHKARETIRNEKVVADCMAFLAKAASENPAAKNFLREAYRRVKQREDEALGKK